MHLLSKYSVQVSKAREIYLRFTCSLDYDSIIGLLHKKNRFIKRQNGKTHTPITKTSKNKQTNRNLNKSDIQGKL